MTIQKDISLKPHNTFGIDVKANFYVAVESIEELALALKNVDHSEKFILNGGSNMLLTKDVESLVVHLKLKGITIVHENEDFVYIKVMAGENWHDFVLWCLERNYGGIENLSLIPGNVGTAPIQNIGAYGVELKDVFESCEVMNIHDQSITSLDREACQFGYRDSIFKNKSKGKFVVTSVTMKLTKRNHKLQTGYGAIQNELEKLNIKNPNIKDISKVVIAIRSSKLPNPEDIGNSGSFFKNPVIELSHFEELKTNFPEIPSYSVSESLIKVPAGWLIEKAGFKGKRFDNYGVHEKQALVLVNYDDAKGSDILNLARLIQSTIKRIFNINLEAEVNII